MLPMMAIHQFKLDCYQFNQLFIVISWYIYNTFPVLGALITHDQGKASI